MACVAEFFRMEDIDSGRLQAPFAAKLSNSSVSVLTQTRLCHAGHCHCNQLEPYPQGIACHKTNKQTNKSPTTNIIKLQI